MDKQIQMRPFHVMDILARCKQMEAQGSDVVHMEIGEPDFPTPQPIIDAGMQALRDQHTAYTSAQGLFELREKICRYYQTEYSIEVEPQQIIITPGASGAIQLVFAALLGRDSKLMLADPTYPCYRNLGNLFGGEVVSVPADHAISFQLNLEQVQRFWQDAVAAVLVASPSNPTGTMCAHDTLLEIADFLADRQSNLIVDEIYQGLTYSGVNSSVADLRDNIFVINSFSKYFGMTGWRIGWLVAPKKYIDQLDAVAQNTYLATSTISQHAALAAFTDEAMAIHEQRRKIFQQRRDLLCNLLADLNIDVPVIPQGAFYVYANVSNHTDDSFQLCKSLLESQAVAVTPGCDFGEQQANEFVRFAYTTNEQRIRTGMQRLKEFIAR
jgi:aspartate/methionine/tyrosine aminotransferase